MPGKGVTRITIRPGISRQLAAGLLLLHGLALLLTVLLPLHWVFKVMLIFLIAGSLFHYRRRRLVQPGDRVVTAIECSGEGEWILCDALGASEPATLCGSSYIHPRLIILNFRTAAGARRSLCLTSDKVEREQLRRLRIKLNGLRNSYSGGL
jgi:hypothetical protein